MTATLSIEPLRVENTVPAENVGHRLALGVQWIDALSERSVDSAWVSTLESIGNRPCPQPLDRHPQGRHALRAAGRVARFLTVAATDKTATPPATVEVDPTNFVLRAYGRANRRVESYATGNDPRRYVPRRLSFTPLQTDGFPDGGAGNIRNAWLWPGSAYPLASKLTALRGRVRRGAAPPVAKAVPWARVVITQPGPNPPNFATETKLGFAHGDDRGEFLVVLGASAVPGGAALPPTVPLRIWVFLPPVAAFNEKDPLASLPLEVSGAAAISDVLRGMATPSGYLGQPSFDETIALGAVTTIDEAKLLFV